MVTANGIRGVLVVTAVRAGGVPTARVSATHDVHQDPDPDFITADSELLLRHIEAWWIAHWRGSAR